MAGEKRPRVALVEAGLSSTHVYSRKYFPRVGIPTLGAVLKELGYQCDLWFQSRPGMEKADLKKYDIVGIGSLSNTIPAAYRLADSLKGQGPKVVMGGPHVTFMAEEALNHCDYVVLGEGEVTFPALLEALGKDQPLDSIPGLAYRRPNGEVHNTGLAATVDYKNLPSPDFSLSPQVKPGRVPQIVVTSRGCPHNCNFCSVTPIFGKRYRFKSSEQVISELRAVLNQSVCFGDDNFCAHRPRAKALLRDMIAQKAVPLRWAAQICVEATEDKEFLSLMRETRCRTAYIGVESVDPRTLKEFSKAHKMEAIEKCIKNLHSYGIGIHGMFVIGMNDDQETVEKTVDYAIEHDIDSIQICSLTPFPGTAVYQSDQDKLLHRDWKYFDGMHVVIDRPGASAYDMQMAIVRGLQRFYSLKRVIGAYRRGRGWRVWYQAAGYYLMRKWVSENRDYLERLRTEHGRKP
ncbi:MAG: radical SAM protein [Planctomycetes bacterium]|nr:radical SAM protein [Planctomycetota bacterium]